MAKTTIPMLAAGAVLLGLTAVPVAACPPPQELAQARDAAFAEADADSNGALTAAEFATFHEAMLRAMAQARFERADANGDGQVTLQELEQARPPRGRRRGPRAES